jgi:hypothetical protein
MRAAPHGGGDQFEYRLDIVWSLRRRINTARWNAGRKPGGLSEKHVIPGRHLL